VFLHSIRQQLGAVVEASVALLLAVGTCLGALGKVLVVIAIVILSRLSMGAGRGFDINSECRDLEQALLHGIPR
jgi:hypothetical protein